MMLRSKSGLDDVALQERLGLVPEEASGRKARQVDGLPAPRTAAVDDHNVSYTRAPCNFRQLSKSGFPALTTLAA